MQSIIVYRNPMEAAIWESFSNGGFEIMAVFMLSFSGAFFLIYQVLKLVSRFGGRKYIRYEQEYATHSIFVSIFIAAVSVYFVIG